MIKIFVIDNPLIPEDRVKVTNKILYSCGRNSLLREVVNKYDVTYIYTGQKNLRHENYILRKFSKVKILCADSNVMRDFSGYRIAINLSIQNNDNDVILVNSSCSLNALRSLLRLKVPDFQLGIFGSACKSFFRMNNFLVKFVPHLQTHSLRIKGQSLIKAIADYVDYYYKNSDIFSTVSDKKNKEKLILHCEVGLNSFLKKNFLLFYIKPNEELIKVPKYPNFNFPFFDSRKNDSRFKM
jgi:hypothetical protein